MMNEPRRIKSPLKQMIKSDSFQKQPSLVRTSSKQHRTSLPPLPRVNPMKPIDEQKVYNHKPMEEQKVYHPKPSNKKRHHSRRLNNTLDDDIPLALLAYKKGYTTMYPSTEKDDRAQSYLSTSSSGSSSQNSMIKLQESKRKKPRYKSLTVPVEKVIEEPVIKEKKWYSSLRKLIK